MRTVCNGSEPDCDVPPFPDPITEALVAAGLLIEPPAAEQAAPLDQLAGEIAVLDAAIAEAAGKLRPGDLAELEAADRRAAGAKAGAGPAARRARGHAARPDPPVRAERDRQVV